MQQSQQLHNCAQIIWDGTIMVLTLVKNYGCNHTIAWI